MGRKKLFRKGSEIKKNLNPQIGLGALKLVELQPDNPAAQLMDRLQNYAIYSPNTPTLRGIAPDQQNRTPVGLNGGSLAEGFQKLQQFLKEAEGGEELLDQLLELVDWVQDIQTTNRGGNLLSPKVPRSRSVLKFSDRFMAENRQDLTAYDASEGALYVIFTAILCLTPDAPLLFSIDNLDQSLNPRLVARLVSCLPRWLGAGHPHRQLLFTAHNPAVLDGMDLLNDEVRLFTVERNSHGHTTIRRLEMTEELQQMNQSYPLSRLWLMGNLGAVPHV